MIVSQDEKTKIILLIKDTQYTMHNAIGDALGECSSHDFGGTFISLLLLTHVPLAVSNAVFPKLK